MKRCFLKILISIFLVLIFTYKVDAGVGVSCSGPGVVTITETSMASPAEFSAKMPYCASKKQIGTKPLTVGPGVGVPEGETQDFGDLNWVKGMGEFYDWVNSNTDDNKGTVPVYTPLCNDPKSRIKGSLVCTTKKDVPARKESCYYNHEKEYECVDPVCEKKCEQTLGGLSTMSNNLIENPNVEKMRAINNNCLKKCKTTCSKTVCDGDEWFCDEGEKRVSGDYHYCHIEGTYLYTETFVLSVKNGINVGLAQRECEDYIENESCTCNKADVVYSYECPIYQCNRGDSIFSLCTPSFTSSDNNKVYCVNAGQPFSSSYSTTASYIKDSDFNARKCESSHSTIDCGYANILIEGNLYGLSNKTIELALRLWAVHNQQRGYDYVGISNRTGDSCQNYTMFMKESRSSVVNPYVRTYQEFRRSLFENARSYIDSHGYIDPSQASDYGQFGISCDSSNLGVACGTTNQYKQAFALLANTIFGNSKMQEHLSNIFKGEINEEISNVNLITDENGNQQVEVHFEELKTITKDINVKINCNELDKMVKENKITEAQKNQISPYCKINVKFIDGNGRVIGRLGGGTPDYCYKDYCRVVVEKFAMCDIENEEVTPIQIAINHAKPLSGDSVVKYISCSNARENQYLFGFDTNLVNQVNKGVTPTANSETVTEKYIVSNYRCAGRCDDYSLRGEVKNKCDDNNENYGGTFNSSIKDPSLKCIVNMGRPEYKSMYDYSEYFGVNTHICRIYCSDEVNIYIADKTKATSGKYFYYDIESTVNSNNKNIQYLFTDIVEEKRTCVSDINYSHTFLDGFNWKDAYGFGTYDDGITTSEINNITNWQTLFPVMVKKALSQGGTEENVNQLLYDLMNCNLYSEEEIKATGVKIAHNKEYSNARSRILELFSEDNKYGLGLDSSCVVNHNTNECVKMSNVNYDFGANNDGKSTISMKSVASVENTFDNMVYCSGVGCFAYDPDNKEAEFDYPTNTVSSTNPNFQIKSTDGRTMNFFGKTKITIPTNDYVMFDIKTNVAFYNASRYDVRPDGKTVLSGSGGNEKYLSLSPYIYTIDKEAYNNKNCVSKNFLDGYKRCNVNHVFEEIKTFFRNNSGDEFSKAVESEEKFSCYVDVAPPQTTLASSNHNNLRESTIFRNVMVSNMFPSSNDGYTSNIDSNWATDNGHNATDQITYTAEDLITTDSYLDYRIVISPTQIKNIKEYNKQNDLYLNEEEVKCTIVDDTYQNCQSPFINELRNSTEYGIITEFDLN